MNTRTPSISSRLILFPEEPIMGHFSISFLDDYASDLSYFPYPSINRMVLPIIIGVGVTAAAITIKSAIQATIKFQKLSRVRIAQLNGLKIPTESHMHNIHIDESLRERFRRFPGGFDNKMTEREALSVLGITPDHIMKLTKEELKMKHRKLMMSNHPDRGGSAYLAMKINEARDILEKSYMFKR
ncbi:CYFA0S44e00100g1_1 [Cyberlindnera fabianii]|uniref:CYFA0S44e00100g1_1 n=1 Tax=Cyberlindnera fabianii TaxID=36022 RepID=A0A061BDK5_CYBFA|nr:CYFA0S44e00100g1_1 [Cyberlindnera fabianii]